jgi:hypothetical protein
MSPDLHNRRRFALITGSVLVTYLLAGVAPKEQGEIAPLGYPFIISNPRLLPIGLALASFYGMSAFLFYGFWIHRSPAAIRSETLRGMRIGRGGRVRQPWSHGTEQDRDEAEQKLFEVFPRVWRSKVTLREEHVENQELIDPRSGIETVGKPSGPAVVALSIPRRVWIAARLQDLDYSPRSG